MARLLFTLFLSQVSGYCNSGNTVTGDSNLGKVNLEGDLLTIDDPTNCPGQVGLVDKTNLVADVTTGRNYVLKFQATTCDTGWARLAYAFIDFNNNGVYDPEELLGQRDLDNRVAPFDIEFGFEVPCVGSGSVLGRTRMRVFVVEGGFAPSPCIIFAYGQVKEFSIDLIGQNCTRQPTPAPSPYCNAGPTVADGSNLGPVTLAGSTRPIIDDDTDCPGKIGVRDLTNFSTTVNPGGAYQLEVDVTTCNGKGYPRQAYAFIDYNHNLQFEPSELLGVAGVGSAKAPINLRFPFQVPCLQEGSTSGLTHMRVFVVEGGRTTDPCLIFAYGGVKDFTISILPDQIGPCAGGESI